jgi:hypothetical protein
VGTIITRRAGRGINAPVVNSRRKGVIGRILSGVARLLGVHVVRHIATKFFHLFSGYLRGDKASTRFGVGRCSWAHLYYFGKGVKVYLRRWLVYRVLVVNWVAIMGNFRFKNLYDYAVSDFLYDQFLGYERLRKVAFALPTGLYAFFRSFLHLKFLPVSLLIPHRVCYHIFSLSRSVENSGIGMPYYYRRFIDFAHKDSIIFDRKVAPRDVQFSVNGLPRIKVSSAQLFRLNVNYFRLALLGGCGVTNNSRQRLYNNLSSTLASQQYTTFCRFFFEGRRRVFSTFWCRYFLSGAFVDKRGGGINMFYRKYANSVIRKGYYSSSHIATYSLWVRIFFGDATLTPEQSNLIDLPNANNVSIYARYRDRFKSKFGGWFKSGGETFMGGGTFSSIWGGLGKGGSSYAGGSVM